MKYCISRVDAATKIPLYLIMHQEAFQNYLNDHNLEGSGKANSYIKALDYLSEMLRIEPYSFSDCHDLWSVNSVKRLQQLRAYVLNEQKKLSESPWICTHIPNSYLLNGYCSAALTQLIEFLPQHQHSEKVLKTLKTHEGNENSLVHKLNVEPDYPESMVHAPSSQDGKDRIRNAKTRIGQQAFRKMILHIYDNRCCITGLDIPSVNRASHIIGWAKRKDTRMDPRNGMCLSATYDAAFDKHLISFDQDYRLIVSKDITEHFTSDSVYKHFLKREGQPLKRPKNYIPKQEYLEDHRQVGNF